MISLNSQSSASSLVGRTVMVTGAASGIGRACVAEFSRAGAKVYGVDRDAEGLDALVRELEGVQAVACDLADLSAVANLPADVDVLVNNVGVQHISPIVDFPLERFDFIMRLMLHSPFVLARHCLPHMYAQGWGRVVNISSVHGLRASAYKSAYVMAKHGLEGLSKTIALEGAEHGSPVTV